MAGSVAEFRRRTEEGLDALLESVLAVRREPERLAYLAAGELTVWARLFGWRRLHRALEPTLLPLLAGTVLRADAATGQKVTLLAGLAAGWLGDVEKLRTPDRPTPQGFLGVAAQHAAYSSLLYRKGARPKGAGLRAAVWAAGVGLAAWKRPQLVPAAILAGAGVSVTSALADDPAVRKGPVSRKGLGHGANLVLVSEGLTLLRAAVLPRDNRLGRLIDAGTATTSVLGHLLLVDGMMRK